MIIVGICLHLFLSQYLSISVSVSPLPFSLLLTALRKLQLALWSTRPPVAIPLISRVLLLLSRGDDDHTPDLGSPHLPWELHHSYAHTNTHTNTNTCFNTPPFALTTLVSACQSVLQWLSLTTELLLRLASTRPPAVWWLLWSMRDWIQNSRWSKNVWNIIQFREVKSNKNCSILWTTPEFGKYFLTSLIASVF